MKTRILCAFLPVLLLAFALPAWATNGTWTNATTDGDWTTAGNWTGGVPTINGETATFDGSEAARGLPTANLLDLSAAPPGVELILAFSADYSTHDISEFSSTGLCYKATIEAHSGGSIRFDVQFNVAHAAGGTLIIKTGTTVPVVQEFFLYNGGTACKRLFD